MQSDPPGKFILRESWEALTPPTLPLLGATRDKQTAGFTGPDSAFGLDGVGKNKKKPNNDTFPGSRAANPSAVRHR